MLEKMRLQLGLEGVDEVEFVAINAVSASAEDDQQALVERCAFPLLQDTDAVDAWGLHDGGKDDGVPGVGQNARYRPRFRGRKTLHHWTHPYATQPGCTVPMATIWLNAETQL